MSGSRWMIWSAVLVAGAIAVAACGGGSSNKDNKTPGASTTAGGNTPAAGKTAGATSASGGGSVNSELSEIGKKFTQSTFNATYKVTGADAAQFSDGTLKLEKDGDKKFRMEVHAKQDSIDTTIIFIESDTVQAFCLKDAGELGALLGLEAGKGVCFPSSPGDKNNPVGSLRDSLKDFENANVALLEKSTKKVAGQDGQCYKTQDNVTSEISTTCFNSDGVILYLKTEGDNASEIEAQSVSGSVNADDFKLPYEQKELPGGLGG